jgi:hypothetical protein
MQFKNRGGGSEIKAIYEFVAGLAEASVFAAFRRPAGLRKRLGNKIENVAFPNLRKRAPGGVRKRTNADLPVCVFCGK